MNIFSGDPILKWEKMLCTFCGNPTGCNSGCEDVPVKERVANMMSINGQIKRLYNANCYFKQLNTWIAYTNFPVSKSLIEKLAKISGIESINPLSAYSFEIDIAKIYDENKVKQNIVSAYKTFIKEKQALISTKKQLQNNQVLVFPNGAKYIARTSEEKLLAEEIDQMFGNIQRTEEN